MKKIFNAGWAFPVVSGCLMLFAAPLMATTYYVSTSGSDTNAGTQAAPFATIQKPATLVNPGDTVIVNPGVYYGPVVLTRAGTSANPITFKADAVSQNRVVLTNANQGIRNKTVTWTLENASLNMYSVPMDHQPCRVLADGVDLLPYKYLAGLQVFMMGADQTYPGNEHGFTYANNKLYVRLNPLYGSINPNQKTMAVAPSPGNGDKGIDISSTDTSRNTFHINTGGAAYVILDGFSFETPGVSCVYIRGTDVTVRNSWFRGCKAGVAGGKRDENDSFSTNNIIIEYCDYSQFPAFDDSKWAMENFADNHPNDTFYWWQRKRVEDRAVESKLDYETSGIAQRMGANWIIRNNNLSQCLDGMSYLAMDGETGPVEVYNNKFSNIIDNAIEFENHANNVRFHHNEIHNVFAPISWQPRGGTPWPTNLWIYKNLIYNDPEMGALWKDVAGYRSNGLKIGATQEQWAWYPWMNGTTGTVPTTPVDPGDQEVWIYNNTIYTPSGIHTEPINFDVQDMVGINLYNNINICGEYSVSGSGTAFVIKPNYRTMTFSHNVRSTDVPVTYTPDTSASGAGGVTYNNPALVGLVDLAGANFSLTASSPARGRGVQPPNANATDWSSDCGAIPYGTTWATPTVGPQVVAQVATPIFSPVAGTYTSTQSVTISTTTSGDTIRYTTDGSTPTSTTGTVYSSPVSVSSSMTLKAIGYKSGMMDSAVATAAYTISATVVTPAFSPVAGTYTSAQSVAISTSTSGASIRYSTDGSTPTSTTGTVYSTPVAVGSSLTIKAIAYKSGMTDSSVASAAYVINISVVATPGFSPGGGTYASAQSVTISTSTSGASIRYTTDGSTPTSTTGTVYASAVAVSSSQTLKAIAYKSGLTDSIVATATYTIGGSPTVSIPFAASTDYSNNFREAGNYATNLAWDSSGVVTMSHTQNWRVGVAVYDTTPSDGQTTINTFGGGTAVEKYQTDFRIGASGIVKVFARVADPNVAGGYSLSSEAVSTGRIALRIPTTVITPNNETDLASTPVTLATATWYTMQLLVQNNADNSVTLTGKVFTQGGTGGTPLATVTYTHASSPYRAAGQAGFCATSGGTTVPSTTTNIDNFVVDTTPPPTIPSAPTGLSATGGNAQVVLNWTASSGATSYNVKRSTTSRSGYTTVGPNVTGTGYANTGLTNGTTYYYVVTAVNSAGESGNSAQASATPVAPPAAPSGLSATASSSTQINLGWTDNASTETGFEVDYSTSSTFASGVTTVTIATPNTTSSSVTGLTASTPYYFRVRATNGAGDSSNSGTANATTLSPALTMSFGTSTDYTSKFREMGNYSSNIGWDSSGVVTMSHTQNWRVGVAVYDTTPSDGQTTINTFGGGTTLEKYQVDFQVGQSGAVKVFARVADPTEDGGYMLTGELTSTGKIALKIPTSVVTPDNESDLASTAAAITTGTWYTLQLSVQNNADNSVTLTGKIFTQGGTGGTPIATVLYTHANSPYRAAGQVGFTATSGGTTAPSTTTNADNFVINAP